MKLADNSGLRKLMRAARRGEIPPERMGAIERAMESAKERRARYANSLNHRIVIITPPFTPFWFGGLLGSGEL